MSKFLLKNALGELDLTDAAARVKYAGSELSVTGSGKFDGNLVEIGWRELFGAKVPFRRRYDLKGTVPAALVAKAGFPPVEPYVTGPIGHDAALSGGDQRHGRGGRPLRHQGRQGRLPPLDWTKEPGTDGQVR